MSCNDRQPGPNDTIREEIGLGGKKNLENKTEICRLCWNTLQHLTPDCSDVFGGRKLPTLTRVKGSVIKSAIIHKQRLVRLSE